MAQLNMEPRDSNGTPDLTAYRVSIDRCCVIVLQLHSVSKLASYTDKNAGGMLTKRHGQHRGALHNIAREHIIRGVRHSESPRGGVHFSVELDEPRGSCALDSMNQKCTMGASRE